MEESESSQRHEQDQTEKDVHEPKKESSEQDVEEKETDIRETQETPKPKEEREATKTDKTVRFGETHIDISDTEDECETDNTRGKSNNPRITISEPVNSPCESEASQKKPVESKGRCPIYYGIKSYIHDFYYPPDKEIFKSGEYLQEDDFQFLVEPGKRRKWQGCWGRAGMWVGINMMLLGVIAMLVGHLTPVRETIVDRESSSTVLVDRWAVTFNNRLELCQMAGLAVFMSGLVISMLALLVSSYEQDPTRSYYVMAATVVPETFVGNPLVGPRHGWGSHRIPLSGTVRGVQPTFSQPRK